MLPPNPDSSTTSMHSAEQLLSNLADLAATKEQKEKPYSLQVLAPVLNVVFSHLNHLEIVFKPDLDTDPYKITLTEQPPEQFTRRVFHTAYDEKTKQPAKFTERGPEELPVFSMTVEIGPAFNVVTDLPEFTQQVQTLHNEQMREYGLSEKEPVYINTNKQLAEYWQFMADQLAAFVDSHVEELRSIGSTSTSENPSLGESVLLPTVRAYGQLCGLLAEGFGSASNGAETALTQEVDNTPWLELAWKQTEHRLLTMFGGLQARADDPNSALATDPAKFIRHLVNLTTHHAQQKMIKELNTQARSAFFHHCEAELWRKAGLGDIWQRLRADDDVAEVSRVQSNPEVASTFIDEYFPESKVELLDLQNLLKENKKALEVAVDSSQQRELRNARVALQFRVINMLRALVFSNKIFSYHSEKYSFSDAIDTSEVNCMVRLEIFHQWYEYICEETTLAMLVRNHVYSVAKLANGKLVSFDSGSLVDKHQLGFDLGDHESVYLAAIINWKAIQQKKSKRLTGAELLYLEAIRLVPTFADAINNLALLLGNNPNSLEEAEALYREAIRIDPTNTAYINNFIDLLRKISNGKQEVEELMLRLVGLEPESFDRTRKLADFYYSKMKDEDRALQWYEKTLAIMDEFSKDSFPDSRKKIRKRMKRIQRSRKIKDLFRSVQRIGRTSSASEQS